MERLQKAHSRPRSRSSDRGPKETTRAKLSQAVLDAIHAQILVIDRAGEVIATNRSWREASGTAQTASLAADSAAANYLAGCESAEAEGVAGAAEVGEAVLAVLAGAAPLRQVEFRGREAKGRDPWFVLTITPLASGEGAVLVHEEISYPHTLEGEILAISERERLRIGQELHDGLCQHLGGVALLAKTLSNALANAGRPEAPQAAELAQLIYAAVGETRTVAHGLRPVELEEDGLLAALQDLADQTNGRVPCDFRSQGRPRVTSNEVATNLYRIATEAVTNAVRHAGATRIVIRLRQSADHLTLAVEDDGGGVAGEITAAGGVGFRTMRYRANAIGARIEMAQRPGGGVQVKCQVPLAGLVRR